MESNILTPEICTGCYSISAAIITITATALFITVADSGIASLDSTVISIHLIVILTTAKYTFIFAITSYITNTQKSLTKNYCCNQQLTVAVAGGNNVITAHATLIATNITVTRPTARMSHSAGSWTSLTAAISVISSSTT